MMPSPQKIAGFQQRMLQRYRREKRDLPWRKTTDPYKIMVSEIMLQQTQVDRVIPYYTQWIERWPTLHDLANASRHDVLKAWMGLGYNNRAMRLHEAAKKVVLEFNGDVEKALGTKLPGIGPYTARAIRIFARNEGIITVDTNIRRILIHEFGLPHSAKDSIIEHLALRCLPKGKSREWHNALMDYGALCLTSRKTGIRPKTRQSKFQGSDRQVRAKILRNLIEKKEHRVAIHQLQGIAPHVGIQHLKKIMERMTKDNLVVQKRNTYALKQGIAIKYINALSSRKDNETRDGNDPQRGIREDRRRIKNIKKYKIV